MKIWGKVLIGVFIFIGVLVFTRNWWIKVVIEQGAKKFTGLDLSIDHLEVSIFQSVVIIKGLTVKKTLPSLTGETIKDPRAKSSTAAGCGDCPTTS